MSPAYAGIFTTSRVFPIEPKHGHSEIAVVFTSVEATVGTLKHAGVLARQLDARIAIIVPQVVPWPLDLTSPPVPLEFNEARFRAIASQIGVPTEVRIYLCRDFTQTVTRVLRPGSIVMVGGRSRWWPTAEKRLGGRLRRAGHTVIFTAAEE